MDPRAVPLIEVVVESENQPPPSFRIGPDDDWMVEWRGCKSDDHETGWSNGGGASLTTTKCPR